MLCVQEHKEQSNVYVLLLVQYAGKFAVCTLIHDRVDGVHAYISKQSSI